MNGTKPLKGILISLVATLSLFCSIDGPLAQATASKSLIHGNAEIQPLVATISSAKTVYNRGEQVVIHVCITNTGNDPAPIVVVNFDWNQVASVEKNGGDLAAALRKEGYPLPDGEIEAVKPPYSWFGWDVDNIGHRNAMMPAKAVMNNTYKYDPAELHAGTFDLEWVGMHPWRTKDKQQTAIGKLWHPLHSNILRITITP